MRRVLVVAAPMVSRGGVHGYLESTLPLLPARGWEPALVWSVRGGSPGFPAVALQRALAEPAGGLPARGRALADAVRDALAAWRPDAVLSLLPQADLAGAGVARAAGVPWLALVQGRPWPAPGEQGLLRRTAWRAAVAWALRRADRVLAVSRALARELRTGLGLRGVGVLPVGVPAPAALPGPAPGGPALGFVGRLAPEKDPLAFLAVAARLPEHPAHVFGDGPLRDAVRAAATAAAPGARLHGWAERDAAFAAVDVVLIPSRREALPLACLEAGLRGRAVVAAAVGGLPELLGADPVLAARCLVPPGAGPEAWAARVRPLLEDAALRADVAARLGRVVAARHALPAHADGLAGALGTIAGASPGPGAAATVPAPVGAP
jgi:glycosyltransferase involved in cell wall biosynthesis